MLKSEDFHSPRSEPFLVSGVSCSLQHLKCQTIGKDLLVCAHNDKILSDATISTTTLTTYISIFTDEAQNCVNTDESPRPANACAAVCDDGARPMNVSHEGDEREQLFRL